jgi:hypothetical protein
VGKEKTFVCCQRPDSLETYSLALPSVDDNVVGRCSLSRCKIGSTTGKGKLCKRSLSFGSNFRSRSNVSVQALRNQRHLPIGIVCMGAVSMIVFPESELNWLTFRMKQFFHPA